MTDPTDVGFIEPLDSSPIDLENWGGGAVEETPNNRWQRCWNRDVGENTYKVQYDQEMRLIMLERWRDGSLEAVPAELGITGIDSENEQFFKTVELFFQMIEPQLG